MASQIEIIANPATEATHYGIPVCHIGDEGDMVALGHPGRRRAFAAFNRHARVYCHLANLADDQNATLDDWSDVITEAWVVFRKPNPDHEWEELEAEWYFDRVTEGTPGSQPVTLLNVASP